MRWSEVRRIAAQRVGYVSSSCQAWFTMSQRVTHQIPSIIKPYPSKKVMRSDLDLPRHGDICVELRFKHSRSAQWLGNWHIVITEQSLDLPAPCDPVGYYIGGSGGSKKKMYIIHP